MHANRRRQAFDIKRYADPTDEVIFAGDGVSKVRYVIYKSSIPSIEAVNKRLAETKHTESARARALSRQSGRNTTDGEGQGASHALGEGAQQQKRRALLTELRRCNAEQLQRKQLEAELKASQLNGGKHSEDVQSCRTQSMHIGTHGSTEYERNISTEYRNAPYAVGAEECRDSRDAHVRNDERKYFRGGQIDCGTNSYTTRRAASSQQRHACDNTYSLDLLQDAEKAARAAAKIKAREYMEANRLLAEQVANERRRNAQRERQRDRAGCTTAPSSDAHSCSAMPRPHDPHEGGVYHEYDAAGRLPHHTHPDAAFTAAPPRTNAVAHVDAAVAAADAAFVAPACANPSGGLTGLDELQHEAAVRRAQTSRDIRDENLRLMERKRAKLHRDRVEERNWMHQAEETAAQLEQKLRDDARNRCRRRELAQDRPLPADARHEVNGTSAHRGVQSRVARTRVRITTPARRLRGTVWQTAERLRCRSRVEGMQQATRARRATFCHRRMCEIRRMSNVDAGSSFFVSRFASTPKRLVRVSVKSRSANVRWSAQRCRICRSSGA